MNDLMVGIKQKVAMKEGICPNCGAEEIPVFAHIYCSIKCGREARALINIEKELLELERDIAVFREIHGLWSIDLKDIKKKGRLAKRRRS